MNLRRNYLTQCDERVFAFLKANPNIFLRAHEVFDRLGEYSDSAISQSLRTLWELGYIERGAQKGYIYQEK